MKRIICFFLLFLIGGINYLSGQSQSLSIPQGILPESSLNAEFIAKFALFVALLLLWTVSCGKLLKTIFRLPIIAGQIIAGILFGPSGIHITAAPFFAEPVQMIDSVTGKFYALASSDLFLFFVLLLSSSFTVSYLLWIAGHETDINDLAKVGLPAATAGVLGALLPITFTVFTAYWFLGPEYNLLNSTGLGLILSATSVSIPVAMLFAQNKMHLKSSKATLGAAIIDDIFAVILLSLFFVAVESGIFGSFNELIIASHKAGLGKALIYLFLGFTCIMLIGYYIVKPFIRWVHYMRLSHLVSPLATGIMLLYFALAELMAGLAGITGAYFAGVFHRMGDVRHHAEKTISPFVNAVLLPLFLCSIGLQMNIRLLGLSHCVVVVILLALAIISKLLGCFLATGLSNVISRDKRFRWSVLESYLFGSSMVARGEVGLVIATILNGARIITSEQYIIAIVVIVLTTIATPIMLSAGFSYQEKRREVEVAPISLNLGLFDVIGTTRLFTIILDCIEASKTYKTTVQISEGRKIAHIPEYGVKIILCPDEGIIFEGNSRHINAILNMVRDDVLKEIDRCTVS